MAASASPAVGDMSGLEGSPISDVKFENCTITANKGFVMQYATRVDLSGLNIIGVQGEKIVKKNVE